VRLLPTPTARDHKDGGSVGTAPENALLGRVVWNESRWGRYTEAIARHEAALGRPAPEPCDEKRRLSPEFVEWMMMLPPLILPGEPWTFGSRTQRLKMLGNAVVPPQALYALELLAEPVYPT
jgi:DNA (cytosine-5)-methyltransferase 1